MNKINIIYKKAQFEYEFIETYNCGIVLYGSEVNSIRNGNCSLSGSYCYISSDNEIFIKGSYIKKEIKKNQTENTNYDENRDRKLLLTKKEINYLKEYTFQKGYTIVPYRIYSYKGLIKCEIKLCKGKKIYDKREVIKKRENEIELNRIKKNF